MWGPRVACTPPGPAARTVSRRDLIFPPPGTGTRGGTNAASALAARDVRSPEGSAGLGVVGP